jgi:hypothetical protein
LLGFKGADDIEPLAKNSRNFVGRGVRELVPNTISHKPKCPITQRQSLTESLVACHLSGTLNLFAGTVVHGANA